MFKLELNNIISSNKSFFEWITNNDGLLSTDQLLLSVKMIDVNNLVSDYSKLFGQFDLLLQKNNSQKTSQIVQAINSAINAEIDSMAGLYISPCIEKNTEGIISDISARLIELNQIHKTIIRLNLMPGSDGKPINLFNLPDYQ